MFVNNDVDAYTQGKRDYQLVAMHAAIITSTGNNTVITGNNNYWQH